MTTTYMNESAKLSSSVDLARLKSITIFAKRYLFIFVIPTWT